MPTQKYFQYLRKDRLPNVWCPGCGNGIIMKSFIEAAANLNLDKNKVAVVSGIGCSSRVTGYLDFNTLHTLHGRAIPFATGVKLARPDLEVVVMGGDGDMLAIGGNHFIHACRRNMNLTVILFNNTIYGMTGGQYSPTTPHEATASTAPYGNVERSFDPVQMAIASGATYVARSTVYHYMQSVKYIENAIKHKGMSVVEIVSNCHTYYGRYNGMSKPTQFMDYFKNNAITINKAKDMSKEELEGKIVIGEFHKDDAKKTYLDLYAEISAKLGGVAK
ncbi:2-oxoacid:ferredoxin oxidoreductase subunit beta [Marinitoga sp. 1135]|uniref:2-oxoacid:ferredoxin oxidoreductase, beta subunit n=1 Tax=Marinitoga piezophila (strain DSM 14283 / JCM 11233 / KA3) TaxID=443254 RepID=H2J4M5_MARPK|nr:MULTISPECIES: 2-oxoacid:ferredoxin oxidoreductase subunit beta [Marinitoga]AEX85967.1 2-oxoacid:ferredoxin oxidoreductase, beta subunit [Marinitoga piezophila KA3]APT76391.1 2-oxoacid:ferredoxin oxidoreductase subunit beta [Marinitoga sp. 1137]NUU96161.1 2-oxoacid:ferredoxin oxidoreductase subunit beta [Marinitoga sp. 1135]NUU98069.1 2-oxoacid:ferredoxin oxidoreductase subunit beta [Marinitoga sp. 1138]